MKLSNVNGNWVADSRDVSELTEKQHGHLLRDIDGYVSILAESNFGVSEFFIESSYQDATGRTLRKYDCTRKGCDMIANKMIGEKGVLFTAAYVSKFEEMEYGIKMDINRLTPEMQMFKHMFDAVAKTQIEASETSRKLVLVESNLNIIKDTIIQREDNWRDSLNKMFNTAVKNSKNQDFKSMRNESYTILEERAHCDLARRQRNMQDRLKESGATKTKVDNVSKIDVIEDDPKLKEIYTSIVKEMSVKNMKMNA